MFYLMTVLPFGHVYIGYYTIPFSNTQVLYSTEKPLNMYNLPNFYYFFISRPRNRIDYFYSLC